MASARAIAGYNADAARIAPRFEALSCADIYAPVADHMPRSPARVLDLGAGTGRDAAWLAAQGHSVLAVEPADALRETGRRLHADPAIRWLADALPDLAATRALGETFDAILLSGVWQHLNEAERERSMPILATLLAPGGSLTVSLRHGPGAPDRPCHDCDPDKTLRDAETAGLAVAARREVASIQAANRAAGVYWTWLVLRRPQIDLPH